MTTQTQIRRGTASQCNAMTPADGEIIYDQTNDRVRIGDGVTLGGIELPNISDIQSGRVLTATDTGTPNHVVIALSPNPGTPTNGMTVVAKILNANPGAADLALNGGIPIAIYKAASGSVTATVGDELTAGAFHVFRFDGTHWLLETGTGGGISNVTGTDGISVSIAAGIATARLNTNNALGVGSFCLMLNASGANILSGVAVAGSGLRYIGFAVASSGATSGAVDFTSGSAPPGTWRNMLGVTVSGGSGVGGKAGIGYFQRTA